MGRTAHCGSPSARGGWSHAHADALARRRLAAARRNDLRALRRRLDSRGPARGRADPSLTANAYRARAAAGAVRPRDRTALIGRATASSDFPSAGTPSRISTIPPIAMITPPITKATVTFPTEPVSISLPNVHGAAIATPVPHA